MNINFGFAGLYQLEKFKADESGNEIAGTRTVAVPWFDNLITNVGMDLLGSGASSADNLAYCRIGVGNTAAANTDNSLVSQTGYTKTAPAADVADLSIDGTYIYRRVTRRFAAGTIAGVNLAEVGMSNLTTGANLFSRSLLKDLSGNPTTISLKSDEVLDVVYELRQYIPAAVDIPVPATIDGVASTVTIRRATLTQQIRNWAARVGCPISPISYGEELGYGNYSEQDALENSIPAATGWQNGNVTKATRAINAYVAGSYLKTVTLTVPLTVGNYATGIGFVTIGTGKSADGRGPCSFGPWGLIFNPKLNKTASRIATVTFGVSWARHTP